MFLLEYFQGHQSQGIGISKHGVVYRGQHVSVPYGAVSGPEERQNCISDCTSDRIMPVSVL